MVSVAHACLVDSCILKLNYISIHCATKTIEIKIIAHIESFTGYYECIIINGQEYLKMGFQLLGVI